MGVEAEDRDEAVSKMKAMMTEDAVTAHFAKKHAGEPMMTVEQAHMGIEKGLKEV